jgi:hypothetical protein
MGGYCCENRSAGDPPIRLNTGGPTSGARRADLIASTTVLGAPDTVTLTLTEFAQQAYRINRAGKLPLLVEADPLRQCAQRQTHRPSKTMEGLSQRGPPGRLIQKGLIGRPQPDT